MHFLKETNLDSTACKNPLVIRVVLYRDTGTVDPGSGPIFGSVSGSEIHNLGIAYAKDTFFLY